MLGPAAAPRGVRWSEAPPPKFSQVPNDRRGCTGRARGAGEGGPRLHLCFRGFLRSIFRNPAPEVRSVTERAGWRR